MQISPFGETRDVSPRWRGGHPVLQKQSAALVKRRFTRTTPCPLSEICDSSSNRRAKTLECAVPYIEHAFGPERLAFQTNLIPQSDTRGQPQGGRRQAGSFIQHSCGDREIRQIPKGRVLKGALSARFLSKPRPSEGALAESRLLTCNRNCPILDGDCDERVHLHYRRP